RADARRSHAIPRLVLVALVAFASLPARSTPVSREELTSLCIEADDAAQCGRLVEARQLRALSRFIERDGSELRIQLVPFGLTTFRDSEGARARSYAVWDYLPDLETVVLFTTQGERSGFMLVQRRGGAEFGLPAEPVLSPDRRHFVTVDVCARDCDQEVTLWRIGADGVAKEATWRPPADWSDASATWRTPGTIVFAYSTANDATPHTLERRLADPSWQRLRAK
ncbi:MAG TPA: hypothetical protein VGL43_00670, partial [Casimicrobiaceae bacterium]